MLNTGERKREYGARSHRRDLAKFPIAAVIALQTTNQGQLIVKILLSKTLRISFKIEGLGWTFLVSCALVSDIGKLLFY